MHKPQEDHMNVVFRIIRYLKKLLEEFFFREGIDMEIEAYTDAGWAWNPIDRKSTSGYYT